jgi:hypothetical protein
MTADITTVTVTLDRTGADEGDWDWAEAATTQWIEEAGRLGYGIRVESEEVPSPERQAAIVRRDDETLWVLVVANDEVSAEALATTEVHFVIEVSDDGATWMPENDEARGTEDTEGETPQDVAQAILVNRITDLAADDLTPGHMRVRVWAGEEAAASGREPLAEAVTTA